MRILFSALSWVAFATTPEQRYESMRRKIYNLSILFSELRKSASLSECEFTVQKFDLNVISVISDQLMESKVSSNATAMLLAEHFQAKDCSEFYTELEYEFIDKFIKPQISKNETDLYEALESVRHDLAVLSNGFDQRVAEIEYLENQIEAVIDEERDSQMNIRGIEIHLLPHLARFKELYGEDSAHKSSWVSEILLRHRPRHKRSAMAGRLRESLEREFLRLVEEYMDVVYEFEPEVPLQTQILRFVGQIAEVYAPAIVWRVIKEGVKAVLNRIEAHYNKPVGFTAEDAMALERLDRLQKRQASDSANIARLRERFSAISRCLG